MCVCVCVIYVCVISVCVDSLSKQVASADGNRPKTAKWPKSAWKSKGSSCLCPPSPSTSVEDHCRLLPNALGKHSRAIPSIYRSHFCPVRVCFVCFAFACNLRTQRDIALRVVGPATTFSGSPCSGRASEKRHVPCNGSNCKQHTQDTEWENALGFPLARFFFLFFVMSCPCLS